MSSRTGYGQGHRSEFSKVTQLEALHYIASAVFSTLHKLIENCVLYWQKNWKLIHSEEVTKFRLRTRRLEVVFGELTLMIVEVLGIHA